MAKEPKPRRTRVDGERDRRGGSLPGKRGIRPHVPTDDFRMMVKTHAGVGTPQETIAKLIGVSVDTLDRHYREELDHGSAEANAKVAGVLFALATDKGGARAVDAAKFWLSARAGWRTREERQHSFGGIDGAAPELTDAKDVKPVKITFEFVGDRPKGLPGCAPEDRE